MGNDYLRPALYIELIVNNVKYEVIDYEKLTTVLYSNSCITAGSCLSRTYLYSIYLQWSGLNRFKPNFKLLFKMKHYHVMWDKMSQNETEK